MEFRDYIRVLSRTWPLLIVLALVGAVVGVGISVLQRPFHEATAQAFLSRPCGATVAEFKDGLALAWMKEIGR